MDPYTVLAGRYELTRALAAGGMGRVWLAHDRVLGRDVAVKTLSYGAGDEDAVERFRREARSTAALSHPGIVTVFDSGTDGDTAFLVMELLPGPTLEAYVRERGPLPEDEVVAYASQIAAGLAAAHGAGVVHRDLKPANVMFDAHGVLKIVDFGIARLAHASAARMTATGTVLGSAPYLSPEQVAGRPGDARSDLYALGCVMMTLLTGRPPFEGDNAIAVAHQHVKAPTPAPSERRPDIDPGLEGLVLDLLEKDPAYRPASAGEVLERLGGAGSVAATAVLGAGAAATVAMPSAAPTEYLGSTQAMPARQTYETYREEAPRSSRRTPWGLLLGLLALVALGAFLVTSLGGEGGSTGTAAPVDTPSRTATSAASPSPSPEQTSQPEPERTSESRNPITILGDLRSTFEDALASGELQGKKAQEIGKKIDEARRELLKGDVEDASKKLREAQDKVDELAEKGDIDPGTAESLSGALDSLRSLLPSEKD